MGVQQLQHQPCLPTDWRARVYAGDIFLLPANDLSQHLADTVSALLVEEFGANPRRAHARFNDFEFFRRAGRLRKRIYEGKQFHDYMQALVDAVADPAAAYAFEIIRLRVVEHEGWRNPHAAAVYHGHRDTWYSHPQCLITWWLPVHDVVDDETFWFYPQYFGSAAKNDSAKFDYDTWLERDRTRKVGWQNRDAGLEALYPRWFDESESDESDRIGFSCQKGDILIFAGHQLHRTKPNSTGLTRFSLDFRAVHMDDYRADRGAPNVDNGATGSAMQDYLMPAEDSRAQTN